MLEVLTKALRLLADVEIPRSLPRHHLRGPGGVDQNEAAELAIVTAKRFPVLLWKKTDAAQRKICAVGHFQRNARMGRRRVVASACRLALVSDALVGAM